MAKILLVDDDPEIIQICTLWLSERKNYLLDTSKTSAEAFTLLKSSDYDLVIIDLGLPDSDGSSIVQWLRANGKSVPILVLTGRNDILSKVGLLDLGADDYLTKPFHLKELEARVKSLLRRPPRLADVISIGHITLNISSARVSVDGQEVSLTPKEFALLEIFVRHPNQNFSQDVLLQRLWSNSADATPDVVRVYIMRLRRKLERPGDNPLIINKRGHGYTLGKFVEA